MKLKLLLALMLVLAVALTGPISGCTPKLNGALPSFAIGDKWVSLWHSQGNDYTVTSVITGEETVNGIACWVMEKTFDPEYLGSLVSTTNKYDKTDFDVVSVDYHTDAPGDFTKITYKIGGTSFYPLAVGKESQEIAQVTTVSGNATLYTTENSTISTKSVVDKIEKITVKAGTFECFKISKYDDTGKLVQVTWRSDKVKLFQVKMTDLTDPDADYQLVSYSLK